MTTKNQHVVPRGYLKNFTDKENKIWSYNFKSDSISHQLVKNVCSHTYAYEVSKRNIDNKLENILSELESELIPYIDKLINDYKKHKLSKSSCNLIALAKFILLQSMRTDSGRILFMRHVGNQKAMDHHMDAKERKEKSNYIVKFNEMFKNKDSLNKCLNELFLLRLPKVRVGISKNRKFLTSDNPVVACYIPFNDSFDETIKIILSISPDICLYTILGDYSDQDNFPYFVSDELVNVYNEYIINAADDWIISSNKFDFINLNYIEKCRRNKKA